MIRSVLLSITLVLCVNASLCSALEALPMGKTASKHTILAPLLQAVLSDYLNVLPGQHLLILPDHQNLGSSRSWSKNRDAFKQACASDPSACAQVLQSQFDTLASELQKVVPDQVMQLRTAVMMSAITDSCQISEEHNIEMGYRCGITEFIAMNKATAIRWRQLGYYHLFLEFWRQGEVKRQSMLDFLARSGKTKEKLYAKLYERDQWDDDHAVWFSELHGNLSMAYESQLQLLVRQYATNSHQGQLTGIYNLARLSALNGETEKTDNWLAFGRNLLNEHPELASDNSCSIESTQFVIDAHKSLQSSTHFNATQRLQNLINHTCPFTGQALQYALRLLLDNQMKNQAFSIVQQSLDACDTSATCSHDVYKQLKSLSVITQGDSAAVVRELEYWQTRLHDGQLFDTEQKIIWTLANRLYESGNKVAAISLYETLDNYIDDYKRKQPLNRPTDLAAYEGLKRIRMRMALEQGKTIPLQRMELLRGQRLLARLRSQRWMSELSEFNDKILQVEYEKKQHELRQRFSALKQLNTNTSEVGAYVVNEFLAQQQELENILLAEHIGKLVNKKYKNDWSSPLWALSFFQTHEISGDDAQYQLENPITPEDAYLSWLQVPGGYIGTLYGVDLREYYSGHGHPKIRKQVFIPFNEQEESLLQLYRDLLQSGRSTNRGAIRLAPFASDKQGLQLNGVPIWQLPDGRFVVTASPAQGSKRIHDFSSLSDALYGRLLEPFSGLFQDAVRLMISPDGALTTLPFETLTRRGVSILESVDVVYIQSLAIYKELKLRSSKGKKQAEPTLLSVADPLYLAPASPPKWQTKEPQLDSIEWQPLPGTRQEAAALADLYHTRLQLFDKQANKSNLNSMQQAGTLKHYRVLHFATHGYVSDKLSALVLSTTADHVGSYLMDQEIVDWTIDSDLVLLSACNTGIGRQQKGEGVVGLPYAFFMAGNINTLMSLWPVDDEGTAALIPAFMQRIRQGEDHVSALNNTKRAFARGDYGQRLSNPRIWSAFVLYGVPLAERRL